MGYNILFTTANNEFGTLAANTFFDNSNDWEMGCDVKINNISVQQGIIGKSRGAAVERYGVDVTNGKFRFLFEMGIQYSIDTLITPTLGQSYNLKMKYVNNILYGYIDGQEFSISAPYVASSFLGLFFVGSYGDSAGTAPSRYSDIELENFYIKDNANSIYETFTFPGPPGATSTGSEGTILAFYSDIGVIPMWVFVADVFNRISSVMGKALGIPFRKTVNETPAPIETYNVIHGIDNVIHVADNVVHDAI